MLRVVNWENLRRYATSGVVTIALSLGVVLIALVAAAMIFWLPPLATANEPPEAALTLIPGPTSTAQPPSPVPAPTSTVTPTLIPLQPNEMGVGSYVQIVGTEGTGLNIRDNPGLTTNIEFLGYDSEVFIVRDGPMEADGFTWWYLVTPVDESRAGWAAADYLSVVANP